MVRKGSQDSNFEKIALIALVIILSSIIFYYNSRNVELRIALEGWGPQDYVNQKLHPEDFRNNWPSGIFAYDNSLPMRIYYYLAKYFEIGPTRTMYPFMFIQTLVFISSLALLSHTLFKDILIALIAVLVLSQSSLAGLDLSRFGFGYHSYLQYPLYYGYATGLSLLGLNFFLKNKYITSCIFIAMAVYCHLVIGILAFVFVMSYLLYKRLVFENRMARYAVYMFVFFISPIIIYQFYEAWLSTGGIPLEDWIRSTRMFSYHWYPLTMELFTRTGHREFLPLVLSIVALFVATRYMDRKYEMNVKIFVGCIACFFFSTIGFLFAELYPVSTIIKISPQRSTSFISFFACVFWIFYLIRKAMNGGWAIRSTAIFGLLILVLSRPGIAVFPMLILACSDIKDGYLGFFRFNFWNFKIARVVFLCVSGCVVIIGLLNIAGVELGQYIWSPLRYLNPLTEPDFLVLGGSFKASFVPVYLILILLVTTFTLPIYLNGRVLRCRNVGLIIIIIIGLSSVWLVESDKYKQWYKRNYERAASYMDLQLWAKNNTEVDALFMPDPTQYYGWRDFSERSSFGNLREWGYSGIVYRSEKSLYDEGLRRIKEFGIDISKIYVDVVNENPGFPYSDVLTKEVRKRYYEMDEEKLIDLARRYGIDFFVMEKRYMTSNVGLIPVYENDHYIVFSSEINPEVGNLSWHFGLAHL